MSQASAPQKQQAEDSGPLEMPEVSHRQTLKLIGSLMFCLVIQMPIAIRKVFMLKRSRIASGNEAYIWYMFVGMNIPVTLYFAKNARLEMKENTRKEQVYVDAMSEMDEDSVLGSFESAMMAFDEPKK